jgi:hypothetical protein
MELESIKKFNDELEKIRDHIQYLSLVEQISGLRISEEDSNLSTIIDIQIHARKNRTSRRIFEYKLTIISLYGLLENYVESWILMYLRYLPKYFDSYNSMDERLRKNHFELSLKLIDILSKQERAKYSHLSPEEVLNRMSHCINSSSEFQLNSEAFLLISGNLKHRKISDLLKKLLIDLNAEISKDEILNEFIGLDPSQSGSQGRDILYAKLDDLVERRNAVAHGREIDEILSLSELLEHIDFLRVYGKAVFNILRRSLLGIEMVNKFVKIEGDISVYRKKIVEFTTDSIFLKVDDPIIIIDSRKVNIRSNIISIQIDREDFSEIRLNSTKKIAIQVGHNHEIKKNYQFYLPKSSFCG